MLNIAIQQAAIQQAHCHTNGYIAELYEISLSMGNSQEYDNFAGYTV